MGGHHSDDYSRNVTWVSNHHGGNGGGNGNDGGDGNGNGRQDSDSDSVINAPSGRHSDFIHPHSLNSFLFALAVLCLICTTLTVAFRLFAQRRLLRKLGWVDFWIVVAWMGHVTHLSLMLAAIQYGTGRHLWDVHKSTYSELELFNWAISLVYHPAILSGKVAILLQLKTIFVPEKRKGWFWWAMWGLIVVNITYYVLTFFLEVFQCHPISKSWLEDSVSGACPINKYSLYLSSAVFNLLSDFAVFLLPVWAIWRLNLKVKKRAVVSLAFAVGLFGCLCSGVRIKYSSRLAGSKDESFDNLQNQMWGNAEIAVAVAIASLIILPRYIKYWKRPNEAFEQHDNATKWPHKWPQPKLPPQPMIARDTALRSHNVEAAIITFTDNRDVVFNRTPALAPVREVASSTPLPTEPPSTELLHSQLLPTRPVPARSATVMGGAMQGRRQPVRSLAPLPPTSRSRSVGLRPRSEFKTGNTT